MKQYYRIHLTSLRLRVDRPLSVHRPLSVYRSLSVHRQNISNGFKRTAVDRMFLYILPFLSSTIYTKLDELTLGSQQARANNFTTCSILNFAGAPQRSVSCKRSITGNFRSLNSNHRCHHLRAMNRLMLNSHPISRYSSLCLPAELFLFAVLFVVACYGD